MLSICQNSLYYCSRSFVWIFILASQINLGQFQISKQLESKNKPEAYFRYQIEVAMGIDYNSIGPSDRQLFEIDSKTHRKLSILERLFGRRRLDEDYTEASQTYNDDLSATEVSSEADDYGFNDENKPSSMPTMGNIGLPYPTTNNAGPQDMVWKNQLIDDENLGFKSSASQQGWFNDNTAIICNRTAYKNWAKKTVNSIILEDGSTMTVTRNTIQNFWGFGSIYWLDEQVPLTRGVAMMKGSQFCRLGLRQLKYNMGGSFGQIKTEVVNDVMCDATCVESDELHQMALDVSGCTCDQLSTPEDSWAWHEEFDFCQRNSARMMCKEFDFCGTWDCPLKDFMCPRYEYLGQKNVVRGKIGCSAASLGRPRQGLLFALWLASLWITCLASNSWL